MQETWELKGYLDARVPPKAPNCSFFLADLFAQFLHLFLCSSATNTMISNSGLLSNLPQISIAPILILCAHLPPNRQVPLEIVRMPMNRYQAWHWSQHILDVFRRLVGGWFLLCILWVKQILWLKLVGCSSCFRQLPASKRPFRDMSKLGSCVVKIVSWHIQRKTTLSHPPPFHYGGGSIDSPFSARCVYGLSCLRFE